MSTRRRPHIPSLTNKTDIRDDANNHKVIWCKCTSGSFCTAGFCLWYFFFSTHFYLVFLKIVAQRVVRLSVSVSHDRYSHAGNCISLPSNTGLFLSTGNKNLSLLQRHLSPFDPWPLLLFRFSLVRRHSFVVEVSDLYFFSPSFSVSGRNIRDLRRVFRVGEGPIYLREALLSRINQIL